MSTDDDTSTCDRDGACLLSQLFQKSSLSRIHNVPRMMRGTQLRNIPQSIKITIQTLKNKSGKKINPNSRRNKTFNRVGGLYVVDWGTALEWALLTLHLAVGCLIHSVPDCLPACSYSSVTGKWVTFYELFSEHWPDTIDQIWHTNAFPGAWFHPRRAGSSQSNRQPMMWNWANIPPF